MKTKSILLALALTLYASSALAGWVFTQDTGGKTIVVQMQDQKVRTGAGEEGVIYDLNTGIVTMLNPSKKQYWQGKPADLSKEMNKAMDQRLEKMLAQAPKDQRAQMREMMLKQLGRGPKGPAPKVEVKSTGKSQKVAGYKAQEFEVYVNGELKQRLWVGPLPGLKKELDMAKLFKLVQKMQLSNQPGWRSSPQVAEVVTKGYPLMMEDTGGGPMAKTVTKKAEQKQLSADIFQAPKGWKKVSFKQMMR